MCSKYDYVFVALLVPRYARLYRDVEWFHEKMEKGHNFPQERAALHNLRRQVYFWVTDFETSIYKGELDAVHQRKQCDKLRLIEENYWQQYDHFIRNVYTTDEFKSNVNTFQVENLMDQMTL